MEEFDGRTSNTLGLDVGKERKGIIKEAVKGMHCIPQYPQCVISSHFLLILTSQITQHSINIFLGSENVMTTMNNKRTQNYKGKN